MFGTVTLSPEENATPVGGAGFPTRILPKRKNPKLVTYGSCARGRLKEFWRFKTTFLAARGAAEIRTTVDLRKKVIILCPPELFFWIGALVSPQTINL